MTVKLETKHRRFDRGAKALALVCPELAEMVHAPVHICPQCLGEEDTGTKVFFREAVETNDLTVEHVPAKSLGGKALILTCAPCNHTSGSRTEAHALKRENMASLGRDPESGPTRVHIEVGDHTVSATLSLDEIMVHLRLPPAAKHANDPRAVDGLRDFLGSGGFQEQRLGIRIVGDAHKPQPARVAWLRAGYLALFAVTGYGYIFDPALGIIRKQIEEPDVEHIPAFLADLQGYPLTERRIMRVDEPEWHRSWAVQIGRHLVFLPLAGDTASYERLAKQSGNNERRARVTASESWSWPTWPTFGIEPDDAS